MQSLLRQSREIELQGRLQVLTTSTVPEPELAVLELGVKLAYSIASVAEPSARAIYLRLVRKTLVPVFEIDNRHKRIGGSFPLVEHPFMAEAVAAREPRMGAFAATSPGPHVREIATRVGVEAGVAVPVAQGSVVHGILAVGWRSVKASNDVLAGLTSIGQLLEVALSASH